MASFPSVELLGWIFIAIARLHSKKSAKIPLVIQEGIFSPTMLSSKVVPLFFNFVVFRYKYLHLLICISLISSIFEYLFHVCWSSGLSFLWIVYSYPLSGFHVGYFSFSYWFVRELHILLLTLFWAPIIYI